MAEHRRTWGPRKEDREVEIPESASYGLVGRGVTSCLSCLEWDEGCRKGGDPGVMRWRKGRVTDSDGAVWHFGDDDGTPEKGCPKRRPVPRGERRG